MFEQLHSGELQLRDIGTLMLEGRCVRSDGAWNKNQDTAEDSQNAQKMRKRFANLWQECLRRQSICSYHLHLFEAKAWISGLSPNARTCHLLENLLLADDRDSNPYLTWSRQDLKLALIKRNEQLPENPSRVTYRLALEDADQNRSFSLTDLPLELRMIVYEEVLQADFGKEISWKEHSITAPPILSVSRQVRREATTIFLRMLRTNNIRLRGSAMQLKDTNFQWLERLGSEKVENLRRVTIESTYGLYDTETEIDLSSSDATKWGFRCYRRRCQDFCPFKPKKCMLWRPERSTKELLKTQNAMDQSINLCGEGNRVRPSPQGLMLLIATALRVYC